MTEEHEKESIEITLKYGKWETDEDGEDVCVYTADIKTDYLVRKNHYGEYTLEVVNY